MIENEDSQEESGAEQPSSPAARRPDAIRRRGSIAVVAAALVAVAVLGVYLAVRSDKGRIRSDSGSAPEGTATFYTTISGTTPPAAIGFFSNRAEDGSPLHSDADSVWLGSSAGGEPDDGIVAPPVAIEENGPLTPAPATLIPCSESHLYAVVSLPETPNRLRPGAVAYLNVFADWNRDGRFDGADDCAEEWAVNNYEIPISSITDRSIAFELPFPTGEQTLELWIRATITLDERLGGPVPRKPYRTGETEDYFVSRTVRQSSATMPPGPCSGYLPAALPANTTSILDAGWTTPSAHTADSGSAPDFSASFDNVTDSAPAADLDEKTAMATVTLPDVSELRYGYVRSGSSRCRFVTAPASIFKTFAPPRNLTRQRADSERSETHKERRDLVAYCVDRSIFSDGAAILAIHRFYRTTEAATAPSSANASPAPASATTGESEISAVLRDPDATSSPTAETTQTLHPGSAPESIWLTDGSGALRGLAIKASSELQNRHYQIRLRSGPGGSIATSCSVTIAGPAPDPKDSASDSAADANPTYIGGDYDVTFSKKSDSCGIFELRSVEWLRIRQYGDRIEVQREAGNLSSGVITSPTSFRATGSGNARDGTPYIESYSAKIVPDGFAGTYDLQRDGCRASFDIEGTRRR